MDTFVMPENKGIDPLFPLFDDKMTKKGQHLHFKGIS